MIRFSRCFTYKPLLVGFVISVVIIEIGMYEYKTSTWNTMNCKNNTNCVKILLAADPQLIGIHNEVRHWLTPLSVWDSDSYLRKTYKYACDHANPDVTVFLGDLFDEGSAATDIEFNHYVRRLFNIFFTRETPIQHVWLPGDNDIGGETERITPNKVKRFNRAFAQPDVISIKNVDFYKINRLTEEISKIGDDNDFNDLSRITVGVSHLPLLFKPSVFVEKVVAKLKPQLLFSAHEHKSMLVTMDTVLMTDRKVIPITLADDDPHILPLGINDVFEIMVPTCSYRMGTDKIGYGYGIIEDGEIRYTVLWSPSRFKQLTIYAYMSLTAVYIFIAKLIFVRCRKYKASHQYTRE